MGLRGGTPMELRVLSGEKTELYIHHQYRIIILASRKQDHYFLIEFVESM